MYIMFRKKTNTFIFPYIFHVINNFYETFGECLLVNCSPVSLMVNPAMAKLVFKNTHTY